MQPVISNGRADNERVLRWGRLKNADVTSDDQLHPRACCQTVQDDMWTDQPPLKGDRGEFLQLRRVKARTGGDVSVWA